MRLSRIVILCFALLTLIEHKVTASCDPLTLEAKFLYWWTCPGDLFIARKGVLELDRFEEGLTVLFQDFESVVTSYDDRFKEVSLPYQGAPGFKLGARYHCEPLWWDFGVRWTHFSPSLNKTLHQHPNQTLIGFQAPDPYETLNRDLYHFLSYPLVTNVASRIAGSWNLQLNMVDLTLGHHFMNYWAIPFRTVMGLRLSRTKENFSLQVDWDYPLFIPDLIVQMKNQWDESHIGVGPLFGISIDKEVACGLGLHLEGAASLVYGKQKGTFKQRGSKESCSISLDTDRFSSQITSSNYCVHPIADFELGFFWQGPLCAPQTLRLEIGWECHIFFDKGVTKGCLVNSNRRLDDHNLTTQGLTVSMEYGF